MSLEPELNASEVGTYVSLDEQCTWTKQFSICCLVTRWKDYSEVRSAFSDCGFRDDDCEYLVCDNSASNRFSAFSAVRAFLRDAAGKYVLIIHQDAFPTEHYDKLRARISEVEHADPCWGVIGNAGKSRENPRLGFLSLETHAGKYELGTPFARVDTIDENVMLIRNGTGITVSADLDGFHFYAFDLCSVAARLGFRSYVVEFQWKHLSAGSIDEGFLGARKIVEAKMREYDCHASAVTTCTALYWGDHQSRAIASACRAASMLDGQDVHAKGFRTLYDESRRRWKLFPVVYCVYCFIFVRSVPLRVYQWIHGRYRIVRKRIGWEIEWWSKNWRSRVGL